MICLNCTTYVCSCGGNDSITLAFLNLIKEAENKAYHKAQQKSSKTKIHRPGI